MNIQIAVVCDAATDSNGRLNLLGAFDTIHTQQLPAVYPQCSIVIRASFSQVEEGTHELRINFVDADGKFIMPHISLPTRVLPPEDSHFVTHNFIVNIQQLRFERPGLYSIDIALDGRQEASIPLVVKHNPPPAAV